MKDRCRSFIKKILFNKHTKLIIIALIATIPILVYSDIPVSHDILFHLSRIEGILYEVDGGNFFSFLYHSFLSNLGYASPLFYPDVFLYPFAILHKIFSISVTYKILMFSVNLATVYIVNFVLKRLTSNEKIINIGTILYTFTSYRMVDMYARGCLGESFSFIFLPLVVLGLYEIFYGNKKKFYYLVIGMTGIIYSHVISTLIVGILILFFIIFNIKKLFQNKRYLYFGLSIVLTFLLSCSFLLPLFEQLINRDFYIHYLDQVDSYNNIYVPFHQLFLELPIPSKAWFPLGIGIIYLYFIYLGIKNYKTIDKKYLVWLGLGIFFLLCSTSLLPRFIYEKFLFLIQYQWRFYMIATVSLFIFGIKVMEILSERQIKFIKKLVLGSSIVVLTVMTTNNVIYRHTSSIDNEYLGFYEYLPEGILVSDVIDNNIVSSSNNDIEFTTTFDENKLIVSYSNNKYNDTVLTLPLLYYKGYVSNKNYDIINNSGLVAINLEKNNDEVIVYYEGTTIAYISRIITFITILLLVSFWIRKKGLYDKVESCV